jgi:hypothetical protein
MEKTDRIVTLTTYYDPMLAEIVKGKLEANGISCYLADENINTIMPIYNQLTGGVKLRVFEHDMEKAELLIAEDSELIIENVKEEGTSSLAIRTCPNCGSANVRFAQATEKRVGVLTAVLSLAMLVYPFYARKSWHCFNCERDFK